MFQDFKFILKTVLLVSLAVISISGNICITFLRRWESL